MQKRHEKLIRNCSLLKEVPIKSQSPKQTVLEDSFICVSVVEKILFLIPSDIVTSKMCNGCLAHKKLSFLQPHTLSNFFFFETDIRCTINNTKPAHFNDLSLWVEGEGRLILFDLVIDFLTSSLMS